MGDEKKTRYRGFLCQLVMPQHVADAVEQQVQAARAATTVRAVSRNEVLNTLIIEALRARGVVL